MGRSISLHIRTQKRRLIAAAARHAGRIDIVDADGVARVSAAAPVPFEPSFDVRGAAGWPMAVFTDESRPGYIFALFSGRTEADFQGRYVYARDVHVFDWHGRLVEILRFSLPPQLQEKRGSARVASAYTGAGEAR